MSMHGLHANNPKGSQAPELRRGQSQAQAGGCFLLLPRSQDRIPPTCSALAGAAPREMGTEGFPTPLRVKADGEEAVLGPHPGSQHPWRLSNPPHHSLLLGVSPPQMPHPAGRPCAQTHLHTRLHNAYNLPHVFTLAQCPPSYTHIHTHLFTHIDTPSYTPHIVTHRCIPAHPPAHSHGQVSARGFLYRWAAGLYKSCVFTGGVTLKVYFSSFGHFKLSCFYF